MPIQYKLRITKAAETDINAAVNNIDNVLLNPSAADAMLDELEQKANDLVCMSKKYAVADDGILRSWGIRFLTVKKYLLFFVIREESSTVYIIRFMHERRNWTAILQRGISLE